MHRRPPRSTLTATIFPCPTLFRSPEFITQILRHPRVWEWVREDGLDSASFAYDPKHTYFAYQDKGFVMYRHVRDGIYDVHAAILRGGRGIVDRKSTRLNSSH